MSMCSLICHDHVVNVQHVEPTGVLFVRSPSANRVKYPITARFRFIILKGRQYANTPIRTSSDNHTLHCTVRLASFTSDFWMYSPRLYSKQRQKIFFGVVSDFSLYLNML